MDQSLTKKDVASSQLLTAIRLFFRDEDPVSVFSLASNAWEIIDTLCSEQKIESISNETREHIQEGADLKRDYINSPFRNFFKHADRDSDEKLSGFGDHENDSIIYLAVEDYIRLAKASPVEFQVFQLWYLATQTEKLADDSLKELLDSIEEVFPSIERKARLDQKQMALVAISDALKNKEVLNDPRTE